MKKILALLYITVVIMAGVFVSGCENNQHAYENESGIVDESKEKNEYKLEDYIYPGKENCEKVIFGCGNYNLNIYNEYSTCMNLEVNVLSYQELNTQNVDVSIDIRTPYQIFMSKYEYEEKEHQQMIQQVLQVCNKDITSDELSALDISSIPKINKYVLMIAFDMSDEDLNIKEEQFDSIKVSIDNKEYEVNVGNVRLTYGKKELISDYDWDEGLSGQTGGAFGYPIDPAYLVDNTFEYSGIMFDTDKDIEITDIGILNDSTLTMKDTILQVSGDMSMDIEYEKGKTIKIKKGSSVNIFMKISDEKLINPLTYYGDAIIYIKYQCGGRECIYTNAPTFKMNYYPYEVYAQLIDGIDVVGYYRGMADDENSVKDGEQSESVH